MLQTGFEFISINNQIVILFLYFSRYLFFNILYKNKIQTRLTIY